MMAEDMDYVCTLSKASIKKAKDELNEIPQDRLAAVQTFRDWIKEQPHITCPKTDTIWLLKFLRAAKFSQIRARSILEGYLGLRNRAPDLFLDIDSHDPKIRQILETGFITLLPKRTPSGSHILFVKLAQLSGVNYKMVDLMRTVTLLMDYISMHEESQVNGITLFLDFSGTSTTFLAKFMTGDSQRWQKMWAKNIPGRHKGFHHYRAGLFLEMITTFTKSFMPKKWTDRFTFHDTMDSMFNVITMECLPDEYLPDDYKGPTIGTTNQICKQTIEDLSKLETRNEILYKTSSAFKIDDNKKPEKQVTDHFRKLNVD